MNEETIKITEKLIIERRDLDDKIALLEAQLRDMQECDKATGIDISNTSLLSRKSIPAPASINPDLVLENDLLKQTICHLQLQSHFVDTKVEELAA